MSIEINLFQPVAAKEKRHNGNTVREVFLFIMICSFLRLNMRLFQGKKQGCFFQQTRGTKCFTLPRKRSIDFKVSPRIFCGVVNFLNTVCIE